MHSGCDRCYRSTRRYNRTSSPDLGLAVERGNKQPLGHSLPDLPRGSSAKRQHDGIERRAQFPRRCRSCLRSSSSPFATPPPLNCPGDVQFVSALVGSAETP